LYGSVSETVRGEDLRKTSFGRTFLPLHRTAGTCIITI
jgi:hypothetical protein